MICRCCGKPVPPLDSHPIHTSCIPRHWGSHAHGRNASRCYEFGRHAIKVPGTYVKCEKYPCNLAAANTLTIEHERPRTYAAQGEIERLTLCDFHAIKIYRDALTRIGGSVESIELEGPAAPIVIKRPRAIVRS